jgi:TolA-binding protein
MIDLITKLIALLEKLNAYFQRKYPKDTGLYIPEGAKRSQATRFWADVSTHLLPILGVVLTLITGFRVWLIYNYYVFLYKLNSNVYKKFVDSFGESKLLLSFIVLIIAATIVFMLFSGRKKLSFQTIFFSIVLIIITVLSITNGFERKVDDYIKTQAYYLAFKKFEDLEFRSAGDVFVALVEATEGDDLGPEIQRAIAVTSLKQGDVKESIIQLADLLAKGQYNESSSEVLLLHTSIYALGKMAPLDEALSFLDELKTNYAVKELSPMWLGIDPQNNLNFIWDYMSDFEIDPADRIVLRLLISKYPDDYYVDLARFAIGDYRYIADHNPNSIFRDWCVYRTAQVAYQKRDFNEAIKYFALFIKEFSGHRWTDDAVFRLARSYELTGRVDYAFDLLAHSDFFPDGDWMEVIRTYRVALLDYYYDAAGLKDLIANYKKVGLTSQIPVLEYSLAEQILKEGALEEAREQFLLVESTYPQTLVAQYASQNIQMLTKMIEIKNSAGGNWPLELAKFVMAPYHPDDNYDDYMKTANLVIYNDLYEEKRKSGVSYVDWAGATWEYYYQANDYLWADRLLEQECGSCSAPDEVLYYRMLAYYNLTYPNAFIPHYHPLEDITIELDQTEYSATWVIEKLDSIGTQFLTEYRDSKYGAEALSLNAIGHANQEDYKQAAQLMSTLVTVYPDSPLANNASIYVARSYRTLAKRTQDPLLKEAYYSEAQKAYEVTIQLFPSGHVAEEAREELDELSLER